MPPPINTGIQREKGRVPLPLFVGIDAVFVMRDSLNAREGLIATAWNASAHRRQSARHDSLFVFHRFHAVHAFHRVLKCVRQTSRGWSETASLALRWSDSCSLVSGEHMKTLRRTSRQLTRDAVRALIVGVGLAAGALTGCAELAQIAQEQSARTGQPGESALARAIKESLELSSARAADLLSRAGGYQKHPLYRIKLPESVQPVAARLRQFGLGGQIDQIETLMNQGAEHAAVEAKALFIDTVRSMSVTDALGIVRGSDTAATQYFRQHTEAELRARYQPIIKSNLQQIGFYKQYERLLAAYKQLPLANKPDLDLEQHVMTQSLNALFTQVAQEEQAIRKDPLGRGSSAIAAVFGR
jgi:hypothetical protein